MKRFAIIAIFMTLLFVGNAHAENQSGTDIKIEQIKEDIKKLETDLTKLEDDVDDSKDDKLENKKDLESLDKRVGDINVSIALFSVFITVLLLAFGFFTYRNAKNDAKKEAENTTKEWIEKEGKLQLEPIIKELKENFEKLAQDKKIEINQLFEQFKQDHQNQLDKHESEFKKLKANYTPEEKADIDKNATESQNKTEKTFDDYWNIIVQQDSNKAYNEMLKVLNEANELVGLTENQKSDLLLAKGFAYNNIGVAYAKSKKYDKAIEAYQKAIDINPKYDNAYNNIGLVYYYLKEYEKSMLAYQKAIDINPQQYEAYHNMGLVYGKLKEYDKAIDSFQKAIDINPIRGGAYLNLFELELMRNQDFSREEQFLLHFGENKKAMMEYEMLKILQTIATNKSYALTAELWSEKYSGVDGLKNWGWDELDVWLDDMQDSDIKTKLLEAIEVFKNHNKSCE